MTVGAALMYTVDIESHAANVYGYSVFLATGSGLTFQAGYSLVGVKAGLAGWSAVDMNSTVSLQNVSQIGGILICLLITGQIFQSIAFNRLSSLLSGEGFTGAEIRNAVSGTQSTLFSKLSSNTALQATFAITEAMKNVYVVSIVAGALSIVCALLMKKERLFGIETTAGG